MQHLRKYKHAIIPVTILVLLLVQAQVSYRWGFYLAAGACYLLFFVVLLGFLRLNIIERRDALLRIPIWTLLIFMGVPILEALILGDPKDIKILDFLVPGGIFQEIFAVFGSLSVYFLTDDQGRVRLSRWVIPILFAVFYFTAFPQIYDQWHFYRNFGKMSALESTPAPMWTATTADGQEMSPAHTENEILIFDFWNEWCGACYKKFPEVKQLKERFAQDKNIRFIALNVPAVNPSPDFDPFAIEKEYGLEVWEGSRELAERFGIQVYPTIVVIKSDSIRYLGDLEELEEFLITLKGQLQ